MNRMMNGGRPWAGNHKLTEKENLLRMYRGDMPEFLPRGGFRDVKCSHLVDVKAPGNHIDEFGVEYEGRAEIFGGSPIPKPGRYVLDDIRRWRDVIHAPDLSQVDWARCAQKDLAAVDRTKYGVMFYFGKIFQRLCDFMGFTEGLCAVAEEPEEVYALFDYLCTYNLEVLKNVIYYYKPEAVCIPDDTATARAPFISPQTYRSLVKPFHARIGELVRNSGVFLEKHDCGRCEAFIDDWLDFGVCAWNPAQPSNDLKGIKRKYGRRLIISGGWDSQGPLSQAAVADDVLRDALAEYVDTLAPGGGFIFSAYVGGSPEDPEARRKQALIEEFYQDYARNWYASHTA